MAQLHPAHPVSDNSPTAGRMPFVLLLAGAGVGGLVVLGVLALWFHYGSQVFFEMIGPGFPACSSPATGIFPPMSSTARPVVIAPAFAASLVLGLLIVFWAMGG